VKIMVDTNILVSGMLFDGPERALLNYAQGNKFRLLISEFSITETRNILMYKFPGKEYILGNTMKLLPVEVVPVPSKGKIKGEKIKSAEKIIRDPTTQKVPGIQSWLRNKGIDPAAVPPGMSLHRSDR